MTQQHRQAASLTASVPAIDPLLRLPAVEAATGFKRSHLYAMIQCGEFPKPVRIGANSVAWRQSDIAAWIAARVEAA